MAKAGWLECEPLATSATPAKQPTACDDRHCEHTCDQSCHVVIRWRLPRSEQRSDIDHHLRARQVNDRLAVDDAAPVIARKRDQLPLDNNGQRFDPSFPAGWEVTRPSELLRKARRQPLIAWRVIFTDDADICRREVAGAASVIVFTIVIIVGVLPMFVPVALILVPMLLGSNRSCQHL